jgi:hypothetical protein
VGLCQRESIVYSTSLLRTLTTNGSLHRPSRWRAGGAGKEAEEIIQVAEVVAEEHAAKVEEAPCMWTEDGD